MNALISDILDALQNVPLTFTYAGSEQNSRGKELLVFSCKELPGREFLYIPGKKGAALGWDTAQCPLCPNILEEFRRYYQDERDRDLEEIREDIAYDKEKLAGAQSEQERGEWAQALRWAEEALAEAEAEAPTWEDYLRALLTELDDCTSPLRTADIPPMLAERRSWWKKEGEITPPFSLPTEDEWEYLCSGGVHTLFPWGDILELEPIYNETLDQDVKNAFGLFIGYNCQAEQVADNNWLKGTDGGCALCGGEGDRAAFAYLPWFRYDLYYPDPPADRYPNHCRRVLRLNMPGAAR